MRQSLLPLQAQLQAGTDRDAATNPWFFSEGKGDPSLVFFSVVKNHVHGIDATSGQPPCGPRQGEEAPDHAQHRVGVLQQLHLEPAVASRTQQYFGVCAQIKQKLVVRFLYSVFQKYVNVRKTAVHSLHPKMKRHNKINKT